MTAVLTGSLTDSIVRLLRSDPERVWTPLQVCTELDVAWRYRSVASLMSQQARQGRIHHLGPGEYAAAATVPVDPVVVDRLCTTDWPSPEVVTNAERAAAIDRLTARGLTHVQIAACIGGGMTASRVQEHLDNRRTA